MNQLPATRQVPCPLCYAPQRPQMGTNGSYIRCGNPAHGWKTFPLAAPMSMVPSVTSSYPPTSREPPPPIASLPLTGSVPIASGSKTVCATLQCKKIRVAQDCRNRMCARCCVKTALPCTRHTKDRETYAQLPTAAYPPAAHTLPSTAPAGISGYTQQLRREDHQERIAQEAADHALALQLADEDQEVLPPPCSTSPPPQEPPLRALSASPTFPPPLALLAVAPSSPSRRRRIPAATAKPKPKTASATITKQLNDTWLQSNSSDTTSSTLSMATSSFNVRQGGRRGFADVALTERFTLVFLNGASSPPIISINFASIPGLRFPHYILAKDPKTKARISGNFDDLEIHLPKKGLWLGCDENHVHIVTTDAVLILRRRGASGPADDEIIQKMLQEDEPHLRHGLARERAAVRKELKQLKLTAVDSDSEVEVATPRRGKGKKRAIAGDESIGRTPRRPRLSINTDVSMQGSSSSTPITFDSPPPSSSSLAPTRASSATPPSSPSSPVIASSPIPITAAMRRARAWPDGMYVTQMHNGFIRMDSKSYQHLPRGQRFELIFKRPYVSATYDLQRKKWREASSSLRDASVAAGETEKGLWSVFLKGYLQEKKAKESSIAKVEETDTDADNDES